jgi:hypothetical protein
VLLVLFVHQELKVVRLCRPGQEKEERIALLKSIPIFLLPSKILDLSHCHPFRIFDLLIAITVA